MTAQAITTGFSSFGYLDVPTDVQTAEKILDYLQQYNRAIMTNTYALLWFFVRLQCGFDYALRLCPGRRESPIGLASSLALFSFLALSLFLQWPVFVSVFVSAAITAVP